MAQEAPSKQVLRWAIDQLSEVIVDAQCWELVQALLLQSVSGDPGCMNRVIEILWKHSRGNGTLVLNDDLVVRALESLILKCAPIGHSNEVLWAIWAHIVFGLQISDSAATAIANLEDSLVATAAMIAYDKGVLPPTFDSLKWRSWFQQGCFYESQWLFVYEAYYRNWFPSEVAAAGIESDPVCRFLKDCDVTFVNDAAVPENGEVEIDPWIPGIEDVY
jgi:hypothetical protein